MITYFNGSFLPLEEVHISPFDRGFQFADGIYEALRTYKDKIFLIDKHLKRLKDSLNGIELKFKEIDGLGQIFYELIKRNNLTGKDVSIYLQVTRGAYYPRRHVYSQDDIKPTVFIYVSEIKPDNSEKEKGVKVIVEKDFRWSRCNIKSLMLLPSTMVKQKAAESGAYEALWERDGNILEGAHTNFFAIKGNTLITPPLSNLILPGITRDFIISFCRKNSVPVKEENIKLSDLKSYDEFFVTGTATEVKPIVQIDDWIVKDGKPGNMTKKVLQMYFEEIGEV